MIEIEKPRIKKRRAGRCSWCGESIPVGTGFAWWPSVNDDGVPNGSCSMHLECDDAYRMSYRETFPKFEFVRGGKEKKPEIIETEEREERLENLKCDWAMREFEKGRSK